MPENPHGFLAVRAPRPGEDSHIRIGDVALEQVALTLGRAVAAVVFLPTEALSLTARRCTFAEWLQFSKHSATHLNVSNEIIV